MKAEADVQLFPDTATLHLPGSGTQSMLFRFQAMEDGPTFGAFAINLDDDDFEPGKHLARVTLEFWADVEARQMIHSGDPFTVWYSKDIGEGRITSILR